MELQTGKCVYILKTGKNLYKIGKTQNLQKRLASYQTHLPVLFRVIRQYAAANMTELEECLHVLFQHKRLKGEWFELTTDDLTICDNLARNFSIEKLQRQPKKYPELQFSDNPLLQVMEANEKYLRSYSRIVEDLKMGLSTNEIVDLYEGTVSKTTIDTVRKVMQHHTPNAEFLGQWIHVVNDLAAGLTEKQILEKYPDMLSQSTLQVIKRILRHQLY
jgi:uncharacterized protein (DUF433 family)